MIVLLPITWADEGRTTEKLIVSKTKDERPPSAKVSYSAKTKTKWDGQKVNSYEDEDERRMPSKS